LTERDGYRFSALLWLANIEDRTHDYQQAIKDYRQVLQMNGDNIIAWNNLAYLLATQTDQLDEALALARKAGELAPGNPNVEGTLGWVLFRKGFYENAVRMLENASHKDGSNATPGSTLRKYHLGMAYLKVGDRQRALKSLAMALDANRNLPEAEAARRLLLQGGAR
jgi:tetratricopeptide (TPR) repeat protein